MNSKKPRKFIQRGSTTELTIEITEKWQKQPYKKSTKESDTLYNWKTLFEGCCHNSPCIYWIIDLRQAKFVYVSENFELKLGFNEHLLMNQGLDFLNELIHPDDRNKSLVCLNKVWDLLLSISGDKRKKAAYCKDYRICDCNGSYKRVLEQSSVLQTDDEGNVTHLLVTVSDITYWKKNDLMTAIVFLDDSQEEIQFTITNISKNNASISKRELEIIRLLAQGLKSKDIAQQLFISRHTVDTHRQRIISKTNTKTTSGLINYALTRGLI